MAKRSFNTTGLTFTGIALGTQIATASSYMGILGTTATQIIDIDEILISGMASASTLGNFVFVPFSTGPTTPTALAAPNADGPMQSNATPTAQTTFVTAATQPTPASATTAARINLGINTFGGIIRWNAAPTQQYTLIGNAAFAAGPPVTMGTAGLVNTTTFGATTAASAHIIYEPY